MKDLLKVFAANEHIDNRFTSDTLVVKGREQLKRLRNGAPAEAQCTFFGQLATEELKLGHVDEAIALLIRANELIPQIPENLRAEFAIEANFRLGLSYLRKAENDNCVACCNGERCIYPIRGGGTHENREGSEKAVPHFKYVIEKAASNDPRRGLSIWLSTIAHMTLGDYPDAVAPAMRLPENPSGPVAKVPRMRNVASTLGLDRRNHAGGVIVDDFNGDKRADIVVSSMNYGDSLTIYLQDADGKFVERGKECGLDGFMGSLNIFRADYDNDGDLDLCLPRGAWLWDKGGHPLSLMRNDGKAHFTDVTFAAGLGEAFGPSQIAVWADYDNDGDLDLFNGTETNSEKSVSCRLFQNQGNGTFKDVAKEAGVTNDRFTKGATWGDFDNDRLPDLYVSNLSGKNRLYRNRGDGTFEDIAEKIGVSGPFNSFSTWCFDYQQDGNLDIFVADYDQNVIGWVMGWIGLPHGQETPALYRGDGKGGFVNVGKAAGFLRPTMTMGSNFGDLDDDGYPDIYLATGNPSYEGLVPNILMMNQRGRSFADGSTSSGTSHLQKGHGVAFADLTGDGRLDIFSQLGGAYEGDAFRNAVYENAFTTNHSIDIKLVGKKSNRDAIGARIRADITEAGVERSVHAWVGTGSSFGGNPLRQHLGLGTAQKIDRLTVYWPTSDTTQIFTEVRADQAICITEFETSYDELGPRGS